MPTNKLFWYLKRAEPDFTRRLGEAFKVLRISRGFGKQRDLVGEDTSHTLTLKTLQRIEQGRGREIGFNALSKAAAALSLSVEELLKRASVSPYKDTTLPDETPKAAYEEFLTRQKSDLLNPSLLPWIHQTKVNVGFLWPDLIVPAPIVSKRTFKKTTLLEWEKAIGTARVVAVTGAPGVGKSTSLRFIALDLTERFLSQRSLIFPIFHHLRDFAQVNRPATLISSGSRRLGLPKQAVILHLIDGVDEVLEPRRSLTLKKVLRLARSAKMIVGCRAEVLSELGPTFDQSLDEIIELIEWSYQANVEPFVKKYFNKAGNQNGYDDFVRLTKNIPQTRKLSTNPFQLTLILFLIEAKEVTSTQYFESKYALYRAFYKSWLAKERHRGTSRAKQSRIAGFHKLLARRLFEIKPEALSLTSATNLLKRYRDVVNDSTFTGLLIVGYNIGTGDRYIQGFRHETLLEYLLAEEIIDALQTGGSKLRDVFRTEYNSEVNSFVREGVASLQLDRREAVASQLAKIYHVLLRNERTASAPKRPTASVRQSVNYRVREQLVYYIGRLGLAKCPDVLIDAFRDDPDGLIRRAAALGAILHASFDVEKEYIQRLTTDTVENVQNRSVELVYRGDVQDSIYRFRDRGGGPWEQTKLAILSRLKSDTPRDIALRWWDLATLKSLLESRPADTLTSEDQKILKASRCEGPDISAARSRAMNKTKREILRRGHSNRNMP